MTRVFVLCGLAILLSTAGCGGGAGGTDSTTGSAGSTGKVHTSTCGARGGFKFWLQNVDCEVANNLVVVLDGRALHQSVMLTAEGKRLAKWVCTSPTHSLVDRVHCQQGNRAFTVERTSR